VFGRNTHVLRCNTGKISHGKLETKEGNTYDVPQILLKPDTENLSYTKQPDHKFALDVNKKKMKGFIDGKTLESILFSGPNRKLKDLWKSMTSVVEPILEFISYGIELSMPNEFEEPLDLQSLMHVSMENNMRFIHYPTSGKNVLRCGAHRDFGTITLLVQDSCGGLEVQLKNGDWMPITPHPEATIFVNFGMVLEMCFGIPALVHRVVDPPNAAEGPVPGRTSAALFIDPDRKKILTPLKKYVPFTREQLKHALKKSSHRKTKKSGQDTIQRTFEIEMQDLLDEEADTEERLDLAHTLEIKGAGSPS